jgi:hypothetical protein
VCFLHCVVIVLLETARCVRITKCLLRLRGKNDVWGVGCGKRERCGEEHCQKISASRSNVIVCRVVC